MKYGIIVLAGGSGSRMNSSMHKQYIEVAGIPIITRTLSRLERSKLPLKVVVVHDGDDTLFQQYKHVRGGKTRAESVWNGLQAFEGCDRVDRIAVHDGVRPFFDVETLDNMLLSDYPSLIPACTSTNSVRITNETGDHNQVIDREKVKLIQTPQVFDYDLVYESYKSYFESNNDNSTLTDDASIVEYFRAVTPHIVEGSNLNIKITTPIDLAVAEWIVSHEVDY